LKGAIIWQWERQEIVDDEKVTNWEPELTYCKACKPLGDDLFWALWKFDSRVLEVE
jgi:hypothetical protein